VTGILRGCFLRWHLACDASMLLSLKLERAANCYDRSQLRKAWTAWTNYVRLCQRKHLLWMQCVWLHKKQLVTNYFAQWRSAYAAKAIENKKTAVALWFWAQSLQFKVIHFSNKSLQILLFSYLILIAITNVIFAVSNSSNCYSFIYAILYFVLI